MNAVKKILFYGMFFVFIAICLGNQVSNSSLEDNKDSELFEKFDLFATVLSIIQNSYVEEVSSKDLIYGALEGVLSSLDPHSQFLRPDLYQELLIETEGQFGGLGMEVTIQDGYLVVVTAIHGSPAAKAGLYTDDRIVKINGIIVNTPQLNEAVKQLRGPIGSHVEITVYRPSTKQYFSIDLVREKILIQSVTKSLILPDTAIGYIKLTKFQDRTATEFNEAMQLLIEKGCKGLILDLRNNPGGLLDEAIKVAGIILGSDKLIVSTKGRIPEQNISKYSDKDIKGIDFPLVILINKGSASGSEIVAGAIQDYKKGIILGENSFGKASVQSLLPLKYGAALRLTTAKYYTPLGRLIHGKGIEPDVKSDFTKDDWVALTEKYNKIQNNTLPEEEKNTVYLDNQIKTALNVISGIEVFSDSIKNSTALPETN